MRRSLPTLLVVGVGLLLLVDFVLINPTVAGLASGVLELIVLLAAAAALAGAATLVSGIGRIWSNAVVIR